jgi:putative chitinase
MTIDRKRFFETVRHNPFHEFGQSQVDGIDAIITEWDKEFPTGDRRWLAYMMATVFWETDHTMRPIREYGEGRGKAYGHPVNGHVYYGRGYVQLTWIANYEKLGKLLGVNLAGNPDLALNPGIAARIMFAGMTKGLFTGKGLANYFDLGKEDWINARRIINGTDHAVTIAGIAKHMYSGLK